jgi:S1-C subfamily serine protease
VVFLAAELRQGDSGSPVIDVNGAVVGVTFAVSPDRPTTAYALAPAEVEALLAAEPNATTGRCT